MEWSAAWDQARSPRSTSSRRSRRHGYHDGDVPPSRAARHRASAGRARTRDAAGGFRSSRSSMRHRSGGRSASKSDTPTQAPRSPFPCRSRSPPTRTAHPHPQRTLDVGQRTPRECSPVQAALSAPPDPGPPRWFDVGAGVQSRGGRCTETSEAGQPCQRPRTRCALRCVRAVPKDRASSGRVVRAACLRATSVETPGPTCDVLAAPGTERRPNPATWVCRRYHLWEHGDTVRRRPSWYATATKIFPAGTWRTLDGCLTPRAAATARSQGAQAAGRRGFTVPVACSVACTVELQVVRGRAVVARGARRLRANRRTTVRARFSPAGKRALQSAQRLTVRLVARAGRRRGRAEDTVEISGPRISAPTLDALLQR